MTPADSEVPRPPLLTPAERARLRPTVDADALERFLGALPDEARQGVQRAAVLHFSRDVTMADIRDFLNAVGNDDAAAAVSRAIEASPPEKPKDDSPGESYTPTPVADRLFTMEPPESPRLRELWDAIEPPPPTSG